MDERQARLTALRRLFGAMSLFMLGWAGLIVWTGQITIHGKRGPPTTYTGNEVLGWAALSACIGIALLGVNFGKGWQVGTWLGLWIIAGIALILGPALIHG